MKAKANESNMYAVFDLYKFSNIRYTDRRIHSYNDVYIKCIPIIHINNIVGNIQFPRIYLISNQTNYADEQKTQ